MNSSNIVDVEYINQEDAIFYNNIKYIFVYRTIIQLDSRYKELAERLVCSNSPNSISSEANSKYKLFLKERIHSKGPWLDLKGAKEKTDKLLLETKDDEDKKILEQLKDHLKSMALL